MNLELFKRSKISETLLKRAYRRLPCLGKNDARFSELEKAFNEHLGQNEHVQALSVLTKLGDLTAPRGGFWKDLMRTAENLELVILIPQLQEKFEQAHLKVNHLKTI